MNKRVSHWLAIPRGSTQSQSHHGTPKFLVWASLDVRVWSRVLRCKCGVMIFLAMSVTSSVLGQGTVLFANRAPSAPDTFQVTFADGRGVGEGFTAQLFGGPAASALEGLIPLVPTTTFTTRGAGSGFVNPVLVSVPGVAPLQSAKLLMRVFDGATWESSLCRGESNPSIMTIGGGELPGAGLVGIRPFAVNCVPEPSSFVLFGCAAAAFALAYRNHRRS